MHLRKTGQSISFFLYYFYLPLSLFFCPIVPRSSSRVRHRLSIIPTYYNTTESIDWCQQPPCIEARVWIRFNARRLKVREVIILPTWLPIPFDSWRRDRGFSLVGYFGENYRKTVKLDFIWRMASQIVWKFSKSINQY